MKPRLDTAATGMSPAVGRRTFLRGVAASLAAAALLTAPLAALAAPKKTVRLLVVGNSFSGNSTNYLDDLAKAAGNELILRHSSSGGYSLEQHWDKAQKHEADPADPLGLYPTKRSLRQDLQAEPWDYITIQQASIKSHDILTYRPFASLLHAYIKNLAPQAEILVHQTWAYRVDDPRFTKPSGKPGEPVTQKEMYDGLNYAYSSIARELKLRVLPVGDAMIMADTDPVWGYKPDTAPFDPKTAVAPSLPDQTHSLHVGWYWKKGTDGKETLTMDGHHAGTAGQYLGACVFYEMLFNEPVVGNTFVPKGMDPAYARYLQETAHKAVVNRVQSVPAPVK